MKTISHILTGIVHGGVDDAASLSLWIDEVAGAAHLCGHSGSMIPLDGPPAPASAPEVEAIGSAGHCAIFEPGQVAALVTRIDAVLEGYAAGADNDDLLAEIEELLSDMDLDEMPYLDWLAENDPSVLDDLSEVA